MKFEKTGDMRVRFFSSQPGKCANEGNRQISRRMDTHGIIVVERFATFHYY